jgi:hypothetical protein
MSTDVLDLIGVTVVPLSCSDTIINDGHYLIEDLAGNFIHVVSDVSKASDTCDHGCAFYARGGISCTIMYPRRWSCKTHFTEVKHDYTT